MTERFTYMEQFNGFCDVYDKGKILSCMRLEYVENTVNLLNEFNDKCEFLEIENKSLEDGATKYAELYHKSLKENGQLKSEIEKITKYKERWAFISDCSIQVMNEEEKFKEDYLRIATNDLKKLQDENEQLKSEIETLHEQLAHLDLDDVILND